MIIPPVETRHDMVVVARTDVADGVVALDLRRLDGGRLPLWQAGSHVDIVLDDGLVRQYSLCSDPADRSTWRIAVLDEPEGRGGSHGIHQRLYPGTEVQIRGPRNHFALEPARSYRFIAGGIGITPILPMVYSAEAAGARWELHYGGRSRSTMAFAGELAARYGDRVHLYPSDETGRMDLDTVLAGPDPYSLAYCCGPVSLVEAAQAAGSGWPSGAIHVERFVPKVFGGALRSEPFVIDLLLSGRTLTVPPQHSILQVVEEAGVLVLSSCQEGTCGTCETPVLEGDLDHRDSVLTPEEQAAGDSMMICVSRALSPRLVLEL